MNPFDWRGPAFLLFYVLLACGILALQWYFQKRAGESQYHGNDTARLQAKVAQDPHLIAYLRAGRHELIRVAIIALLGRGLLVANGDKLQASPYAVTKARRPLDKAILTLYKREGKAQTAFTDATISSEIENIHKQLRNMKLLPNETQTLSRFLGVLFTIGFLWFVAGQKITLATARGHHNIGFLLLLAVLIVPIAAIAVNAQTRSPARSRTNLGDHVLNGVRRQFAGLGKRSESLDFDGQTGEIAFYAAAIGSISLPPKVEAIIEPLDLNPPARPPNNAQRGNSSCGGSCGSSCGSSCGGGGCGGCG
ncbi:MAG: TIGR04222 domain-containing membrane protein [Azoarcus sp.]|jgi:uncharacterized protein (TIGR04222 family)|nr:TIGR04222 domain-containing membrane protein [Azoarcus sp.]